MVDAAVRVLTLPGWQNSGPDHWQSLWERAHGFERVEQHDWMHPLRGDWIARLDEVLLADTTGARTFLAAHSLGCVQVAAWASHSRHTGRVHGALLVAPGDVEREDIRPLLPSWQPIAHVQLPFPSLLVGSRNDPYCTFERAQALAAQWGAGFHDLGAYGHINSESGLGAWPEGLALLRGLMTST